MTYVIYDTETRIKGTAKTLAAAKGKLTRMRKEDPEAATYEIAEREIFEREIEQWVTRTNLMTGKEYRERVNTPIFLSPAFETYWSM